MSLNGIRTNLYKNPYINFGQQIQTPKRKVLCSFGAENIPIEQKFNSIISPLELKSYYEDASKYLNLDYIPRLNLVTSYHKNWCGGYSFQKNEITLNIKDLLNCEYKILGKKNGVIMPLVNSQNKVPLFASKEITDNYVITAAAKNYYGFDSILIKPTSTNDKKRYIIQRLVHELMHAQQHMILRQTEGINEKEILKAWFRQTPKNKSEEEMLDYLTEKKYKESFWAEKPPTKKTIKRNSEQGELALKWLNAIKHYSYNIGSEEYETNEIEKDANKRSAKYVWFLFGSLIA